MDILLFGGNGFIGGYLARSLLKRKDCGVVIAGRGTSLKENQYKAVQVVVILTQPNPKVIEEVVSFINSSRKLKKIVYLSTILLYPESLFQQKENVLPDPKTTYEAAKYEEEKILSKAIKSSNHKFCIARLTNTYGDIKNNGIINNIFLEMLKDEKKLVIEGDLKQKIRDYIFVEDAVKLLEFLIFYNQKNQKEIFNICTGIGTSLSQIFDKIELVTKKKISFKLGKPVLEKKVVIGDNSKILKLSKYKLKYPIINGLQKTYLNYSKAY